MKIASNQLEAFYTVAKTRNFTKAAELLHISQSALSQRILNLEAEIQTALLVRDRTGIELTEVGQELLQYCQFQNNFENEFLGKLKSKNLNQLAGVIRIAGFSSIMRSVIIPSMKGLILKNPGLQLQAQTRELHELLQLLKRGEVDFIILDYEVEREGIEAIKLGVERNVLVEPRNYSGPDVYLDHDEKDETTRRYLKLAGKPATKLRRHFLNDIYGIIDGVKNGFGRAVLPEHLLLEAKGIEIKNPKLALEVPIFVLFHKQPLYSHLQKAVLTSLIEGSSTLLGKS